MNRVVLAEDETGTNVVPDPDGFTRARTSLVVIVVG